MATDLKNQVFAELKLSGTPIKVGLDEDGPGYSVWFQTDDNPEPVYISVTEAELFIAAIQVAISRAKEE